MTGFGQQRSPVGSRSSATIFAVMALLGGASALVLASPAAALQTTSTFTATVDTRVQQANPNTAYGSSFLAASKPSTKQIESLLRFQVAGLPAGAVIASATLRLYATAAVADGPAVYKTSTSWTGSTTWNTRPAAIGSALADSAAIAVNAYVPFAVKAAVAGNGQVDLLVRGTSAAIARFNSRESTANKPLLVVVWDSGPCAGKVNGAACDDANVCTTGTICTSGTCSGGTALNCNDANGCTADACSPTSGCTHTASTGSCDIDGSACTVDTCSGGSCSPGAAPNCSDTNPCTDDTCNTATGCVHVANSAPCNADNNACTSDACSGGACAAGAPVTCDDSDPCTLDTCNTSNGSCSHQADSACGGAGLVSLGASWRYLVTSAAPASTWKTLGFSDSSWPAGAAPLGYGDATVATTIGYGGNANSKFPTTYFRRTFQVADPAKFNALTLTLHRDDGAVVYLNGVEIFRSALPTGAVGYGTWALYPAEGDRVRSAAVNPSLLIQGTNVLAIEVHQAYPDSSQLFMNAELARKCPVPMGDAANEVVETLCDGLDNDCDGNTDLLLPVPQNQCTTGAPGGCGAGYAGCIGGEKVCLTSPAVVEVKNGIDDDCDGTVDEASTAAGKPLKVRVLMPNHMWAESPTYVNGLVEMLQAGGIPHHALTSNSTGVSTDWWDGFASLGDYAVVLIPGYTMDETLAQWQMDALNAYMQSGGIVVLYKPIGPAVLNWAGLSSHTKINTGRTLRISGERAASLWLDAPEERDFLLSKDPSFSPVSTYVYGLNAGTQVWASVRDGATELGPTWTRKAVGAGAVYTLGYDPLSYTWMRCYVNCFDPGRDILPMMLKGLLREGGGGHFAVKNAAPGAAPSVAVMSHDIDAPDSHNPGAEYGAAGALQMADMELAHGVKGSYMVTTDYVAGYNNAALPTQLCERGMCPTGGHSIQHLSQASLPLGNCYVDKASYDPANPTLCGETVVNLQVLAQEAPSAPKVRSWRSPYLSVHANQFEVLASQGVEYDSSFAVGDLRTNFPLKADRWPYMDHAFKKQPLWELPICQEDGMGDIVGGVTTRTELQSANQSRFLNNWYNALKRNSDNGAWNVTLVHPSYGVGVGPENLIWKVDSIAKFLDLIAPTGIVVDTMTNLADWWKARDQVTLDVDWQPGTGYVGTVVVGSLPIKDFAIEFADNIASFACPGAGTVQISGRRVVFKSTLAAGTVLSFQAGL